MATKISVRHRPPHWISVTTAIVAFLLASKSTLINSLPIDAALLSKLDGWYGWVLNAITALSSILTIALGVAPDDQPMNPQ